MAFMSIFMHDGKAILNVFHVILAHFSGAGVALSGVRLLSFILGMW